MDRNKVMDAIETYYKKFGAIGQVRILHQTLMMIPDSDLIILAQQFGIDTDSLFKGA